MAAFRFKQFVVEQDNSAMKVNTDGVLLGAWMGILESDRYFLDIGTGTGVIALMCAQRVADMHGTEGVRIVGIEIDEGACRDAKNNVAASPWPWIEIERAALQGYNSIPDNSFDLIFSNPPYFINSLKSDNSEKMLARHADSLSQMDLLNNVLRLLRLGGRFAVILPVSEGLEFIRKTDFVGKHGDITLSLTKMCEVKSTEKKSAKRLLLEFEKRFSCCGTDVKREELTMFINGCYSEQYSLLVKDFYLI